jgi:hypothetical protein
MGIFDSPEQQAERERIRKRASDSEQQYAKDNNLKELPPEEKGAEELDLEEVVPGGSYLSMATPIGLGRGLIKKLGKEAMEAGAKSVARAGAQKMAKESTEAAGKKASKLGKLREDGVPPELANRYARPDYEIKAEPGALNYSKKR